VSAALAERPAGQRADHGGGPARRAVVRWAWRLLRREWRQQLLVLALLTIAVAVTAAGAAIAADAPQSPDATFGTANQLLTLPGADPHLAADLAAARNWFGTIEVIENQNVAVPGTVNSADLRAQDPSGVFGHPMLRLDTGHYPAGPGQVAMTAGEASVYRLRMGGIWHEGGRSLRVVGLVENPQNLLDNFALVPPGQASPPDQVTILLDANAREIHDFRLPAGAGVQTRLAVSSGLPPSAVLVFATIGLLFIGLVAVAGFTVLAQRRLRALGMLGAVGATDRHVRLVLLANGAVVGALSAVTGAMIGLAGWIAFVPRLETLAEHRIDPLGLPWWEIGAAMGLAVVTALAAAWWPARMAARVPVVAALSGRPPRPQPGHRFAALGGLLLLAGLGLIAASHRGRSPLLTITGIVATAIGTLLLGPLAIRGLAAAGRSSPIAARLALRDLARYQARSGAALAAIILVVGIAAAIAISAGQAAATAAAAPAGGNLPASQLIVYLADAGAAGPGSPIPDRGPARIRALQASVDGLARALRGRDVIPLDAAYDPALPDVPGQGSGTAGGAAGKQAAALMNLSHVIVNGKSGTADQFVAPLYVATKALLQHYGIKPGQVEPTADILTSRTGLADAQLNYDFSTLPRSGRVRVGRSGTRPPAQAIPGQKVLSQPARAIPGQKVLSQPRIQKVKLPVYSSDPNSLITSYAVHALGLKTIPAGWLIQTVQALTPAQVTRAAHWAAVAGVTIETRSEPGSASLTSLSRKATAAGVLVALVVLSMTVGLIRSETAGDLRVLTATGASAATRRAITSATAGALALLGALIGTAGAYLAIAAWNRSAAILTHAPAADLRVSLVVLIVGLPLAAAAGGWLLAGREPSAIARQPLA
jgi:putative ABC transport system permease protein